ncbi:TetR/AcrR family transcriptional regulator [Vibrio sp. JC009]|uniref:TetR/AcrR family transcriptional regulator n=1 Tax=Vibrio sp. JC009 TaxID=2912314 RepID=UPI0023AF5911|nr:TetR/AcrR family transcriptional regulator [Vibrio sp. JC009]WED24341.1 TetR/AcrR family transcriptional regulator [Vibrio sp. JC009]
MSERKQGRRSAQAAEETKIQILTTAANMFCESGYEKVSLRNISEAAGVSHSLIRHHFGSKEQIWYAISDKLHEYMQAYIFGLLEHFGSDLPANVLIYKFSAHLHAHMLLVPKPMQFTADVVRQEDKFFDYMVDGHGKIEHIFDGLVNKFNQEHPDDQVNMWEQKWQLITSAHGAISLRPFMKEIWPGCDLDQQLLNHWRIFNKQIAHTFLIPEDQVINTDNLRSLLLPMAECWEHADGTVICPTKV